MEEIAYKRQDNQKKRQVWLRIIYIVLAILLIGVVGTIIYGYNFVHKSLPIVEGEVTLPVKEEVIVETDEHGVPHIKAKNMQDLYTTQGYIQAQHRLFQMELSRRQASGTLSEVIGEATVDNDKYFRTLGLRRAAEKSYDVYSDEAKEVLQWFSDGVNAYIEEATDNGTLPVEFTLLGTIPEPWTPLDSLTIGKYMAFDLGGHWERQAFNYYLLETFDEAKALELFPSYPENAKTMIEDVELDIATSFKDAVVPDAFNGSNNWVVSGEKTTSGKPYLADDPHLGLGTPSIWLQMHLEAEDMNVSGVIFAGVPGIILGHNEQIAWGVTNTGPDVQQLYIEKRNPDHATQFLFEEEWEDAEVIAEPIIVKDGETIDYEVVETRHGPIISEFAKETGANNVLSLRWTALDATTELQAILQMNRATDWESFEKGLEDFHAPVQNFVFADVDGTIAYKANGKIPIYEDGTDALLPLEGWEAKNEWNDFISFDELPKVVNPEKGFIATANNKVVSEKYPYHISNVWAQPYRYERIFEVLDDSDALTVEDMQALQMDATNLRAREFIPYFVHLLEEVELDEREQQLLHLLEEWNFVDDKNLAAPLLFDQWFVQLEEILYTDIDEAVFDLFSGRGQTTDELLRLGNDSIWVAELGTIEHIVYTAFREAIASIEEDFGKDESKWKWGDFHQVQFKHPLSSANKLLGYFFDAGKPLPVDGSAVTPLAARAEEDGIVNHGASWRFVIDMHDPTTGYHTVSPGQSGHFRSEWYRDQAEDWVDGTYHETVLDGVSGSVLKIIPK